MSTPLWAEPFGLATVEAMALGVPVAALLTGSMGEIVAPQAGDLAVHHSAEALADGLVHWLRDPARRAEVGRANRARMVADHDLATQCVAMGAAFADIEALK